MRLSSGCGEHLVRTFSTIISVFSEQKRRDEICLQSFETDVWNMPIYVQTKDNLKVHKIEIFFGFDFEICIISLLV